ncbi:hypothetical protein ES703_99310 [subsurface metagenome]
MVTGLSHRVENVVVFDEVPAPGAVIDADARPRNVVNRVVADNNLRGHREEHTRCLLADDSDVTDQIVVYHAQGRVVRRAWADGFVRWVGDLVLPP